MCRLVTRRSFKKTMNRKGPEGRRGPAKISEIGGAGMTVKFSLKSAEWRYCVRKEAEEKDVEGVEDVELDPPQARTRHMEVG